MSPRPSLHLPVPLALCAALLTVSAGCSFAFVDGPPANHRKLPFFSCTSSNTLPIVDLVVGGALAASSAGMFDGSNTTTENTTAIAVAVGEAALFAASAVYGFSKTSACKEANAELMARLPPTPTYQPGYHPQQQPAYDPWLYPAPNAFAAPSQPPAAMPPPYAPPPGTPPPAAVPPAASPPGAAPAKKEPTTDTETPRPAPTKP
jgi:hypothetical protein